MKKFILFTSFNLYFGIIFSQISGNALSLIGNAQGNNHIDVGLLQELGNGDFSVEMWINVQNIIQGDNFQDPAIFSNKNWDSGNNTGINLFVSNTTTGILRVNYKTSNSARIDINTQTSILGGWRHIALTVDRNNKMIIYLDGRNVGESNISNTVGTLEGNYSYKLGQDGIGTYIN